MRNSLRFFLVAGLLGAVACGTDDNGTNDSGGEETLPPADTIVLADPADTNSNRQALCASDTLAYDALHAFIAANNAQIENVADLVRAVVNAERRELDANGQVSYSASGDQRSLTMVVTKADDNSLTYLATFTGPNVSSYTLLTGSANADRTSGAWNIFAVDGKATIAVTWTKSGDDLNVVRRITGTDRVATYDRVGSNASVVFTGNNYEASASWDTTTGNGSVTVNGEAAACFTRTANDFCSEPC